MRRLSRWKLCLFALLAVSIAFVAVLGVLLAVDVYLHHKYEKAAGLNVWGYRGPTVGRKQSNEIRIAVLGGSTALGYGLAWQDAFPHQLEVALNATPAARTHQFVVVNLGFNNNGAWSFHYTLSDYQYLNADVICLYEGYNDLRDPNRRVSRHESPVFLLTGYFPILPVIAAEKAMQLRHGGDLRAAYRGDKIVFRPNLMDRTKASVLEASIALADALGKGVNRGEPAAASAPSPTECGPAWSFYCSSVAVAVAKARDMRKAVLVVTQPYVNDAHREQQHQLRAMLAARWGGDTGVRAVDLGSVVDLKDDALCWDGVHLTRVGNQRIADNLVAPVLDAALVDR